MGGHASCAPKVFLGGLGMPAPMHLVYVHAYCTQSRGDAWGGHAYASGLVWRDVYALVAGAGRSEIMRDEMTD